MEPSARTKSMPTTLEWLCPPTLLTAHQSDKFVDLHVQFVKYVVLRREDPCLMKASRALVKSLKFYQVSFSLPLLIVTEVWCVPWDPCDEQSPSQKGIDVIVSAASQAYQFDPICRICCRTWLTRKISQCVKSLRFEKCEGSLQARKHLKNTFHTFTKNFWNSTWSFSDH